MLEGKNESATPDLSSIAGQFAVVAFAMPAYLFAGILILAGGVALGNPNLLGGVALSLPAGLLLVVLVTWMLFQAIWLMPRRTISAFKFDGSEFSFQTPTGWHRKHATDIHSICKVQGRRRRPIISLTRRQESFSWWLYFCDGGWAVLPSTISNSAELISMLNESMNAMPPLKAASE